MRKFNGTALNWAVAPPCKKRTAYESGIDLKNIFNNTRKKKQNKIFYKISRISRSASWIILAKADDRWLSSIQKKNNFEEISSFIIPITFDPDPL